MILAILYLHVATMPPTVWAKSDEVPEEMLFEDFKDGHHLGYWNRRTLAILNLYVATMAPTKFQPNPIYDSGGDVDNVKG